MCLAIVALFLPSPAGVPAQAASLATAPAPGLLLDPSTIVPAEHLALIAQYACLGLLGVSTFLLAFLPAERWMHAHRLSARSTLLTILALNLLVAFGMVLGRMEYINSYVIFTQPVRVLRSMADILTSPDQLRMTLAFWLLCCGIYLLLRAALLRRALPGATASLVPGKRL